MGSVSPCCAFLAMLAAAGCVTEGEVGSLERPTVTEVHVMGRVGGQALPQVAFGAGAADVTDALAVRDQRISVIMSDDLVGVQRFDEGSVQIMCDGEAMPFVTEGREQNEWDPATRTLRLVPRYLRTRARCSIEFADFVTDAAGNRVCAPPDGDPSERCLQGDTSLVEFGVEPFVLTFASPADATTDVPAGETSVLLQFRPSVDDSLANLAHVRIADGAGATPRTVRITSIGDTQTLVLDVAGGLRAGTDYTVTIDGLDEGLADMTGGVLESEAVSVAFRTVP